MLAQVPTLPVSGLDRFSVLIVAIAGLLYAVITNIDKIDAIIQRRKNRTISTPPSIAKNASNQSLTKAQPNIPILVAKWVFLCLMATLFYRRFFSDNLIIGTLEITIQIVWIVIMYHVAFIKTSK